ncbi:MAG TPA: protein kinase [Kofleriaceae bacterium]|nr:protein kinase [Kofleriaceae bacterium]
MQDVASTIDRYQVVRRIGAGGMGVVYEADDLERSQKVALKTISNPDVEKIYQLKREFRALADLSHPNLVALYDLVVAADSCFFTMELLDGVDLLTYLWGRKVEDPAELATTTITPLPVASALMQHPAGDHSGDGENVITQNSPRPTPCDIDKLRGVLPQLARGLHALHCAGKIHRDVKPSNIQVTSDGRAVLLDFGLVAELERRQGADGMIVGTVAYMAPEQCAGDVRLTAAADWYGLGVVVFQALTGRLPFEGVPTRVLFEKQTEAAPRPSRVVQHIPPDLDALCAELLEREPGDRPTGSQILRRLGVGDTDRMTTPLVSISRDGGFTGRTEELAMLEAALGPLALKRASIALIRAPSGMGKTSLVSRFFERLRATHPNAVLLRGRCLEREDVPYKAIDHLIDELSDWWLELSPKDAQALLPRDAHLLPTLFPVLDRVPAIADSPRTRLVADPQARRTHAFDALRETLQRLGDRHTVVLFLDDMQWVDRDTTALLADLMRAPDPPPVLLVLSTRTEGSAPVVDLVRRMDAAQRLIDLGPLAADAALAIAMSHLGEDNREIAERLVREADGSPLFLIELTRYLHGRSLDAVSGKGLDAMLSERIDNLGEAARMIAELVAVAGEPLTRTLLAQVSAIPAAELSRQLSLLRAQRVVRMSGSRAEDTIESYHARVRSAVLAQLPPERRARHHRALATALSGKGTAQQLARHWYGAGDLEHAAGYARRAGDEARARLDFDLSSRWYAIALEGPQWTDPERRGLQTQLADALADAGRPRDAADQFLLAAKGADAATTLELRRRAAGSLLQSGYVAEGLELTRTVLAGVGLAMARTPRRGLMRTVLRRAWLRLRGLGFRARALAEISQAELTRVDVCEGVSFGLAMVDTFRSMDFGTRFLLSALRLGERWRVSRAIALETDFLAATAKTERAVRLLGRLEELTTTLDELPAAPQLLSTRGFVDFFIHSRFRSALANFTQAIASYRAVVGRAGFELDTVSIFCCWALYYLGEIGELSRRVPAMAEAAARNGNRYTAVTLRCAFPIAWLARFEPDAIEAELDAALGSWSSTDGSYQLQHLFALSSRIDLALYRRRPEDVTPRIAREWKLVRRSLVDRPPLQGLLLRSTLLRHAIACANQAAPSSTRRREALIEARGHLRGFRGHAVPVIGHCARMFEGMVAEAEGRPDAAAACYRAALPGLAQTETHLFEHATRDRLGRLLGGDEGAALRRGVRDWLAAETVRDPDTMLDMLLPVPSRA